MITGLLFLGMIAHSGNCEIIANDRIVGEDLAKVLPAFANKMPGDVVVGYAPLPGSQRIFKSRDLQRVGAPYGVTVPSDAEACFEWRLQPVTAELIRGAVRESLHLQDAQVDVLSISVSQAPAGRVIFPVSGLFASTITGPETPVTWRGEVIYHGSRTFSITARVKVSSTMTRVVATELIEPGQIVLPEQVRLETYDDFPLRNDIARNLEEVVGRISRRPLRAGQPVLRADLIEPFQVQRGDLVDVTAISGRAQLHVPALAETAGRQGDLITLKNSHSGKTFRARVEGRDRALIIAWPLTDGIMAQTTRVQ